MQNITRVSLHTSKTSWCTMEDPTPSLNFAFKLPTSIFTTGNARTRKSTAPPRILEINCLCPHQACLMLRHHPPALPNRDPLTRSRNLGPLHHLPHRPSPRNKTFLRFSAQMESFFTKKMIAASDSVSALYARRKTICQTSAHLEKRMHKDKLTTWNLSLRTQGRGLPFRS